MTEATDGSAAYSTPGESLAITVVSGSSAADPLALAQADLAALQGTAGYKLVSGPTSVTLAGRSLVKVVYTSTGGTNAVTGKPFRFTNVRFYVPADNTKLAVLAYSVYTTDYDPQNADDLATTFKWL